MPSYQFNITVINDAGDSLTTIMTLTVEDVAEAMEKASLHAWGKNYYRLAYDTIWLKDSERCLVSDSKPILSNH